MALDKVAGSWGRRRSQSPSNSQRHMCWQNRSQGSSTDQRDEDVRNEGLCPKLAYWYSWGHIKKLNWVIFLGASSWSGTVVWWKKFESWKIKSQFYLLGKGLYMVDSTKGQRFFLSLYSQYILHILQCAFAAPSIRGAYFSNTWICGLSLDLLWPVGH